MLEMFVPGGADAIQVDDPSAQDLSHAALYEDDGGITVGLCCCSLPLAAALGASLSMIPPATAEEMVADGALTPMSADNLYEVMNMFSSLFMDDQTSHLKLTKVEPFSDSHTLNNAQQISFELSAGAYGKGCAVFSSL